MLPALIDSECGQPLCQHSTRTHALNIDLCHFSLFSHSQYLPDASKLELLAILPQSIAISLMLHS